MPVAALLCWTLSLPSSMASPAAAETVPPLGTGAVVTPPPSPHPTPALAVVRVLVLIPFLQIPWNQAEQYQALAPPAFHLHVDQ